jgi:hypothetical protein
MRGGEPGGCCFQGTQLLQQELAVPLPGLRCGIIEADSVVVEQGLEPLRQRFADVALVVPERLAISAFMQLLEVYLV